MLYSIYNNNDAIRYGYGFISKDGRMYLTLIIYDVLDVFTQEQECWHQSIENIHIGIHFLCVKFRISII